MFEDLYDAVSLLWSWRWPAATGKVTAVDVERLRHTQGGDTLRLSVAYEFSVGDDGPYTGESFWHSAYCRNRRVAAARHRIHVGQAVLVRYRTSDPSVNRIHRSAWRRLK